MSNIEFIYEGQNLIIQCNENDKLEKIIQNFCTKVQKSKEKLNLLYNGRIVSNYNLTLMELANSVDKKRKSMSIIATDNCNNNDTLTQIEKSQLKEKLNKANKTISEQKSEIQDLKYQITLVKSESVNQINNLMNNIEKKDEQIKNLKGKIKNLFCPNCKKQLNPVNNSLLNKITKFQKI